MDINSKKAKPFQFAISVPYFTLYPESSYRKKLRKCQLALLQGHSAPFFLSTYTAYFENVSLILLTDF